MEYKEEMFTPRMVSYLDILVYGAENEKFNTDLIRKLESENIDEQVVLPELTDKEVYDILWELGVDTQREVEEKWCLHKPFCLTLKANKEDTPKIYGKAFFGFLRQDDEWKLFCAKNEVYL